VRSLSFIVSEIQLDIDWKIAFFMLPLRLSLSKFHRDVWCEKKLEWWGYVQDSKQFDDIFNIDHEWVSTFTSVTGSKSVRREAAPWWNWDLRLSLMRYADGRSALGMSSRLELRAWSSGRQHSPDSHKPSYEMQSWIHSFPLSCSNLKRKPQTT